MEEEGWGKERKDGEGKKAGFGLSGLGKTVVSSYLRKLLEV